MTGAQQNVQVPDTYPVPIWSFVAGVGANNTDQILMLVNLDNVANIAVGNANVQVFDSSVLTLPPGGSMSIPANQSWYAISDQDYGPILQVTLGGGNWAPSAQIIAQQVLDSGLATAIAQQIFQTGVPIVGAPNLLFQTQAPSSTNGCLVGLTIFGVGTTGNWSTNATNFNTDTGRQMGYVSRKEFNLDTYPTTIESQLQPFITANTAIWLMFKPNFSPLDNSGAEYNKMKATINTFVASGVPLKIVMWQEANNQLSGYPTATQFKNGYAFYYSRLHADFPTIPVVYCAGSIKGETSITAYDPTPNCDEYSQDMYANTWLNGVTFSTQAAIADGAGKPFSVSEFGATNSNTNVPKNSDVINYINYITSFMTARLQANKPCSAVMYYSSNQNPANNLSGPSDYRVPALQAMFDALGAQSGTNPAVITINGGASATLTPINPSPGGGYAVANDISYDAYFQATAGASSTVPFCVAKIRWFDVDAPKAPLVDTQEWVFPLGNNGTSGAFTKGRGPQRGQYLQIIITNLDTVPCTISMSCNATSRNEAKHNWIWDASSSVAIPTYSKAQGPPYKNILGTIEPVSIGSGNSVSRLCSLFAGRAWFRMRIDSGGSVQATISPQPSSLTSVSLFSESPTAQEVDAEIILPRMPCVMTLTNNDTVSHTVSGILVADN